MMQFSHSHSVTEAVLTKNYFLYVSMDLIKEPQHG